MARVKQIIIQGYRSINDPVNLSFPSSGPLVLLGENNAGKSNIIRAIDLVLGERWPGSYVPEDHEYFGRNPADNPEISIHVDLEGCFNYGDEVESMTLKISPQNNSFEAHLLGGGVKNVNNQIRQQCTAITLGADRNLGYQLSYSTQYTLLSKLMHRFHKSLVQDERRKERLKQHFGELRELFAEIPEFSQFTTSLQNEVDQLSTNMRYGLHIDFSAYDPSNFFKALRIQSRLGTDVRSFDELGTGQQQVLALGFAYAYGKAFGSTEGLILLLEEPESHLHPLAQEWLATQLRRFDEAGVQIVITTHNPNFLDLRSPERLALVRKQGKDHPTYSVQKNRRELSVANSENRGPDITPDAIGEWYDASATSDIKSGLFARAVVLVEGQTEALALPVLLNKAGLELSKLGIAVVGVGGKGSMPRWQRFFKAYEVPVYAIFDNDSQDDRGSEKRSDILNAAGVPDEAQPALLGSSEIVIEDAYTVFGVDFETSMRASINGYSELENEGDRLFGGIKAKPLKARWVAHRVELADGDEIHKLAEKIRGLVPTDDPGSSDEPTEPPEPEYPELADDAATEINLDDIPF